MRHMTIAAVLIGALTGLVGTAAARPAHRDADVQRVYRDCMRDGRLDGRYEPRLLRRALKRMPGDLAKYSSCPRVIKRTLTTSADTRDVQRIYRQCMRSGRVRDGFTPRVLRRALREMPGDLADYTSCPDAIRAALRAIT